MDPRSAFLRYKVDLDLVEHPVRIGDHSLRVVEEKFASRFRYISEQR